jgi:hypothetical protein
MAAAALSVSMEPSERRAGAGVEGLDPVHQVHQGAGRDRDPVRVDGRHVGRGRSAKIPKAGDDSARPKVRRVVERDVVGVAGVGDPAVRGRDPAVGGIAQGGHLLEGDGTRPLVGAVPARDRKPRVGLGANRHDAAGPVADGPVDVGEHEVVAGIDPRSHGRLELAR